MSVHELYDARIFQYIFLRPYYRLTHICASQAYETPKCTLSQQGPVKPEQMGHKVHIARDGRY